MKMTWNSALFLVGLAIAIITSVTAILPTDIAMLAIGFIALFVGIANITEKESQKAGIWAIVLGIVGIGFLSAKFTAGIVGMLGLILTNIGLYFLTLVGTTAVVVLYKYYRDK